MIPLIGDLRVEVKAHVWDFVILDIPGKCEEEIVPHFKSDRGIESPQFC